MNEFINEFENNNQLDYNQQELSNSSVSETSIPAKRHTDFKLILKRGVAIIVSAALFGGVAGGVFNFVAKDYTPDKENTEEKSEDTDNADEVTQDITQDIADQGVDDGIVIPTTNTEQLSQSSSMDVSAIAESVMPSVVSITIKAVTEYSSGFWGGSYEYETEGSGSGIIIGENDTELLIVTNNHVVSDAETVSVCFIDGEVYEAQVKGLDGNNDLAIIVVPLEKLTDETISSIKIAEIGSSDELKVGEQVVAIGNALGYGQSVTTGIVSAKDRIVETNATPLIQTDAAINPGNSGGALLNMKGQVVGINSSKYASYDVEGMGYAIPVSKVEPILDELMNRETREKVDEEHKGYLGISCTTISSDMSQIYGMPAGVLVSEVIEGSAAERAGIKKNNIITKFDGQSVSSADALINLLDYYRVGEEVTVTLMFLDDDEYEEKTVRVILGRNREQ